MPEMDGLNEIKEFCLDIPQKISPFSSKVPMRWIGECRIGWPDFQSVFRPDRDACY